MFYNKQALIGIYDSALTYPKFWTFGANSIGSTITNFNTNYTFTSGDLRLLLGPNVLQPLSPNILLTYTFNISSQGLTLLPKQQLQNAGITRIDCGISLPRLLGSVDITPYNGLQYFTCTDNGITSFTGSQGLTGLQELTLNINNLSGDIVSLSGNVALTKFECRFNQLTGFTGTAVLSTLRIFEADNNLLITPAVNTILAAFVSASGVGGTRILNLGGTGNQPPSGQGITDKATLVGNGWTVVTN
jgi:hypothetical protein